MSDNGRIRKEPKGWRDNNPSRPDNFFFFSFFFFSFFFFYFS
jgi:hypothetical protein